MERITATYFIETPIQPGEAAAILAGEQSYGTFVAVPGETPELRDRFAARVESVKVVNIVDQPSLPGGKTSTGEYTQAMVRISWPVENFG
ncbi:MAG: ribulose 1,5-bisphosphate carboxylase, partial [Ginsengibacter sp.]